MRRESDALYQRLDRTIDRGLALAVSNHFGAIMAAFGDAGYHTGLAMGLELAALTFSQVATLPVISVARRGRKGRSR